MNTRLAIAFTLLLAVSSALSACGSGATPAPTATTDPTSAVPTVVLTAEPTQPSGGVDVAWEYVTSPQEPVVARVNGVDIGTEAYLAQLRQQLHLVTASYGVNWYDEQSQVLLPGFQDQVVQQMVQVELAGQLASAEGIVIPDAELEDEIARAMDDVTRSGQYETWEDFSAATGWSQEAFQDQIKVYLLYQKLMEAHGGPEEVEQVNAAHILVSTEEVAAEVLARLEANEAFADLAKELSEDPGSKEAGGDLGWFPRGVMVPEFEEVAFALNPGETSKLVQSQFGYHIIRVLGKEVRPLSPELLQQARQQNFQVWFDAELEKANVETLVEFEKPSP
jgi:foldase protein PrsA